MLSQISLAFCLRKGLLALCVMVLISACGLRSGTSDSLQKVKVAVLLPLKSKDPGVRNLAKSAERAARMAMWDLRANVAMTMRVYDTAGSEMQAAKVARLAGDEGAQIIVGPLFGGASNAVGLAVAKDSVNVLSLSNNADIAGGNVYVLGHTYQNSAERLVNYAFGKGKRRALIVHSNNLAGYAGANAVEKALVANGTASVGKENYNFTQQDVVDAMGRVAIRNELVGADIVFLTADYNGALPLIAQLLPEAGVNPATVQYAGVAQWNSLPSAFSLPGIQGGWFALPSPTRAKQFRERFESIYQSVPHPIAAIAYDGVAAVGASIATGSRHALTARGLTLSSGFQGAAGIFRLREDGTIERGLAIATIEGNQVVVLEPAPRTFNNFGF
ncbi:penicillin-binding protein activator [bacterium]|nr:penicillin-binding protein activator [bacterium]